LTFSFSFFT